MRILLLSFHFPPDAPLAATRAPKLAKYLLSRGHDVMVLCARDPQPLAVHALDIEESRVIRTGWRDLRAVPSDMIGKLKRPSARMTTGHPPPTVSTAPAAPIRRTTLRRKLSRTYESAICRPDGRIGWMAPAVDAAEALLRSWVPDIVYATCPPHSTAVIADRIARRAGAKLVTEFRDRWALDAYSDHPRWRQALDRRQEADILRRAAGIVTVSPLWAESYRARYPETPLAVVMNGFDGEDYPPERAATPGAGRDRIELLHAGALYPGRRDPRPVFEAISRLGEDAGAVTVTMLGKDLDAAREMARDAGVEAALDILPAEPHRAIVERQYRADALLLLQWDDPRDSGTIPGKLFECIGARRPVLATGYSQGVVADIVRERRLGILSNDPGEIAGFLRDLLRQKRSAGHVAALPEHVRAGFERAEQFATLDAFLETVASSDARLVAAE